MTTFYQQQYTPYNHSDFPSYHHYLLYTNNEQQKQQQPTEKLCKRLSFTSLLKKKPSLSRTLSMFSRDNKKKQSKLSIVTPLQMSFNTSTSNLDRMDSMTTSASSSSSSGSSTTFIDEEDYQQPITPTSLAISIPPLAPPTHDHTQSSHASYNNSCLSVDLETALTIPTDKPKQPIDYTGQKYSNFYIKLPNGNWMVRIRDSNRKIVGTYEVNGSMI